MTPVEVTKMDGLNTKVLPINSYKETFEKLHIFFLLSIAL